MFPLFVSLQHSTKPSIPVKGMSCATESLPLAKSISRLESANVVAGVTRRESLFWRQLFDETSSRAGAQSSAGESRVPR